MLLLDRMPLIHTHLPVFYDWGVGGGGGGVGLHMAVHSRMPLIHTHLPVFKYWGGGGGNGWRGGGTTCSSHTDVAQTTRLACTVPVGCCTVRACLRACLGRCVRAVKLSCFHTL